MRNFDTIEEMELRLNEIESNFSKDGYFLSTEDISDLIEIAKEYKGWFKVAVMISDFKAND